MQNHQFEFDGNWEILFYVAAFEFFNDPELEGKKAREVGYRPLMIDDELTLDPDPTLAQLTTIAWLQQPANQERLIDVLFDYCKTTVYPQYQKHLPAAEYPEAYPDLNQKSNLKKLLGRPSFQVLSIPYAGSAHFIVFFETVLDREHGIGFLFYQDELLSHGAVGELDYDAAISKAGDAGKAWVDLFNKHHNSRHQNLEFYLPHPKYNTIKPWQESSNRYLHSRRVRAGRFDLIDAFFADDESRVQEFGSRYVQAILTNRTQEAESTLQYLLQRIESYHFSVFETAVEKNHFEVAKRILATGYDINQRRGQESPFGKAIVGLYKNYQKAELAEQFRNQLNFLRSNGLDPLLPEKWGRNAFFNLHRYAKTAEQKELASQLEAAYTPAVIKKNIQLSLKPWWQFWK